MRFLLQEGYLTRILTKNKDISVALNNCLDYTEFRSRFMTHLQEGLQ